MTQASNDLKVLWQTVHNGSLMVSTIDLTARICKYERHIGANAQPMIFNGPKSIGKNHGDYSPDHMG